MSLAEYQPTVATPASDLEGVMAELEGADRILVQQVFKAIANEYRISIPADGSADEEAPLLFAKQKKLRIKEDIRFRLDPDADDHVLRIKSRNALELNGRHDVLDADDAPIGLLEKDFRRSLLRSHWHVRDAEGNPLLEAHESSWIIALIRRGAAFLPEWLDVGGAIPFNFVLRRDGRDVGRYRRVLGKLRDRYVLEVGPELTDVDRRLLIAFAVALDALQDR
jgi:uncharacterized protein YxjI